jgi:hypothetical protein
MRGNRQGLMSKTSASSLLRAPTWRKTAALYPFATAETGDFPLKLLFERAGRRSQRGRLVDKAGFGQVGFFVGH